MRRIFAICAVQLLCCTAAFAENPRWQVFGKRMPALPNLPVRWDAPTNDLPSNASVYRLTRNDFSGQTVSNLLGLCALTSQDKKEATKDGIAFESADGMRKLSISFLTGTIRYDTPRQDYGPTNLAVGVPPMSALPDLATNVLEKLGFSFAEIIGYFGNARFEISEPTVTTFFINGAIVTNIPSREISFRRCVDGMPVSGGDGGRINFGEHGKLSRILISWHTLERLKTFPAYSPAEIVRLLREGKCFRGAVPGTVSGINWPTVKSVVIKDAKVCCCAGKSDVLYPFVALTAVVDTDEGPVNIEVDSPIIDEAQPLSTTSAASPK